MAALFLLRSLQKPVGVRMVFAFMNKGHEIIFSACSNNLVGFLQNK